MFKYMNIEKIGLIISFIFMVIMYFEISNLNGNQSHNNMPPYYVLTYIIKL